MQVQLFSTHFLIVSCRKAIDDLELMLRQRWLKVCCSAITTLPLVTTVMQILVASRHEQVATVTESVGASSYTARTASSVPLAAGDSSMRYPGVCCWLRTLLLLPLRLS